MLIKIFYLINIVLCDNELKITGNNLTFVIDKNVSKMLIKGGLAVHEFQLKELVFENNQISNITWDKYFPKPQFYRVEFGNLNKYISNLIYSISCFSDKFEMVCSFKIKDRNGLVLFDFYDLNGKILNIEKQNGQLYVLILISNQLNMKQIKNSSEYFKSVEKLRYLYVVLIFNLFEFINIEQSIFKFIDEIKISNFGKSEAKEARKSIIESLNTVVKSLALLSIPSRSKVEFAMPIQYYKKNISSALLKLRNIVSAFEQKVLELEKSGNITSIKSKQILGQISSALIRILNENKFVVCENIYNEIKENLKALEIMVKEVVSKSEYNRQNSHDSNKVDKFVEKYFAILFEYSKIMKDLKGQYLFDYFFDRDEKVELIFAKIEMFYIDKFMCEKLYDCLTNYSEDKSDFIEFFYSDYVKKKLSFRILKNLEMLHEIILTNEKEFADTDSENLDRIKNFKLRFFNLFDEWKTILSPNHTSNILTFDDLVGKESDVKTIKSDSSETKKSNSSSIKIWFVIFVLIVIAGIITYFTKTTYV